MTVEHKLVSLADFKAKTDGPGGFEGYISKWGELDDGGDIVAKGAHTETIPQFLEHGFITNNHDWAFASILGYPVNAYEDDEGTWMEMAFHSTPDAQAARVKAFERKKAGRSVRLSMGYEPSVPPLIIRPDDYATEIPKYSKPAFVAANIEKAGRFPQVRILLKDNLFEGALVGVPMLGSATVTAVKSAYDGLDTGLTYADYLATVVDAVKALGDRTEARIAMRTKEGRVLSSANLAELSSAADELEALMKRIRTLLDSAQPKPKEDDTEKSALAAEVNALLLEHYARQPQLRALNTRR